MITYDPFWKFCKEKGITQYSLEKDYGLSHYQLDKLRNNKNITLETLNILCEKFNVGIEKIIDYKKQ